MENLFDIVKYWHRFNPIFSAVKRIELAKAMVSVFTLQVAMLTQFGKEGSLENCIANGATGISVCGIITIMAILMLTGVKKDYNEVKRASW